MVISVFASGCATNYHAAAVKDARSYAMKKFPDLNEDALHWIRFTSPQIQQNSINRPTNEYSSRAFAQTCFIWNIPEYDGKSLVVVGFSDKRLKHWYPVRAMIKRYSYIESTSEDKTSDKKSKKKNTHISLGRESSIK